MDFVSHAGWGYASLRWRGRKTAWLGAMASAAPDLLTFIPPRVKWAIEDGWSGLARGGNPDPEIWFSDGPPLPPDLVEVYNNYYVYTHSLVILAGRRHLLWFGLPYALNLLMDIPTHERFQTPFLYPVSSWTFEGVNWGHPLIFWPNVIALVGVLVWLWLRYRKGEDAYVNN